MTRNGNTPPGGGGGYGGTATRSGGDDAPGKAQSASGTNNQIAGVDEADIVKTDGMHVYLAANGALRIAEALKPRMVSLLP